MNDTDIKEFLKTVYLKYVEGIIEEVTMLNKIDEKRFTGTVYTERKRVIGSTRKKVFKYPQYITITEDTIKSAIEERINDITTIKFQKPNNEFFLFSYNWEDPTDSDVTNLLAEAKFNKYELVYNEYNALKYIKLIKK